MNEIKNTFKITKRANAFFMCLFLSLGFVGFSQVQQNGVFYIGDNGLVSIGAETTPFNFGTPATASSVTTRTASDYGKLHFRAGTSAAAATDAHHLNGYASTTGNAAFVFPVGSGTVYAPLQISSAVVAETYDSAYVAANPASVVPATSIDSSLEAVSSLEYWDVISTSNAIVSLSWRSASALATELGSGTVVDDVTVVGLNSGTNQWDQLISTVDATSFVDGTTASSLTAGSVSTDAAVDFSVYTKFTLGKKGSCAPLVASDGVTVTWNGSWSPNAPTLTSPVVIAAAYPGGSFACNSLALNADVTLLNGESIEVVNAVTGSSKVILAPSASFVQRAAGAGPTIEFNKMATDMSVFDYIYFGTPVSGNFFDAFASATANSVADPFDLFFKFTSGGSGTSSGWSATSATVTGEGLIARVKDAAPFSAANADISLVINGTANNGDISVMNVSNNPAQANGGSSHVLLGNPYPSAIDGDLFLAENEQIAGSLFFWNSATPPDAAGLFSGADYSIYNSSGVVGSGPNAAALTGAIPSGQGFKVRILPNSTNPTAVNTTNINFTNCMRITDDNGSFFKSSNNVVKDRFKVTMTGANGIFSQILVAYLPQASLGYDRLYDAGRNSVSPAQFYSIMENDGRKLAINGRPSFTSADVVPVGMLKSNSNSETFNFSISEEEGVFTDANVAVYMHDKINGTYHNLKTGDFSFTTSSTSVNDRFELVYVNSTLSNGDVVLPTTTVVLVDNMFSVTSSDMIKDIQVFDLAGRLVESYKSISDVTFNAQFTHAEGMYVANVLYESGVVNAIKMIHDKK